MNRSPPKQKPGNACASAALGFPSLHSRECLEQSALVSVRIRSRSLSSFLPSSDRDAAFYFVGCCISSTNRWLDGYRIETEVYGNIKHGFVRLLGGGTSSVARETRKTEECRGAPVISRILRAAEGRSANTSVSPA